LIQSKYRAFNQNSTAIMRPIAQQIITDINARRCIKEMGLLHVVEERVTTTAGDAHAKESRNKR